MCLLDIVNEAKPERGFSQDLVNRLFETFAKKGYIDEECTILRPNALLDFLEYPATIVIENGTHKLPPGRDCSKIETEILYFRYDGQGHFVRGDGRGDVTYDPWGFSNAVKHGRLVSKRIFRRPGQ
jgi:hypothetical protein